MRQRSSVIALCVLLLVAAVGEAADAPVLWTPKDLTWVEVPEIPGAARALLWGDPAKGAYGALNRWKFNTKLAEVARASDAHFVILAGTFSLEIEGGYKEFGPGSYVMVPKGVKHALGCEAAGECRFLMHQPGPADVLK